MQAAKTELWRRERILMLGWESLGHHLETLELQIHESGYEPTVIVGIRRGGLVPAVALSHRLGVREFQQLCITRNRSDQKYSDRAPATIDGPLSGGSLEHARVLIADDIAGDGGTLQLALRIVQDLGVAEIRTAVIVKNQHSRFTPDYYSIAVDDWVVFPWELPPAGGRIEHV